MYMVGFLIAYILIIGELMIPLYVTDLGLSGLISLGTLAIVIIYSLTCQVSRLKLKPLKLQLFASLGLQFVLIGGMCVPYMMTLVDNFKVATLCYCVALLEWVIFSNRLYKAITDKSRY